MSNMGQTMTDTQYAFLHADISFICCHARSYYQCHAITGEASTSPRPDKTVKPQEHGAGLNGVLSDDRK